MFSTSMARDGMEIGACFGLGYVCQALALQTMPAAVVGFLLSLTTVVCPALEAFVARKRQPPHVWLAAALAVAGAFLLECGGEEWCGSRFELLLGLGQPFFFGVALFLLERAMSRQAVSTTPARAQQTPHAWGGEESQLALALAVWEMVAELGIAVAWASWEAGSPAAVVAAAGDAFANSAQPMIVAGALLWVGVVTTAASAFAEAGVLAHISSADATIIFASEPLWAAGWAWFLLGETMGPSGVAGGATIMAACLLSGCQGFDNSGTIIGGWRGLPPTSDARSRGASLKQWAPKRAQRSVRSRVPVLRAQPQDKPLSSSS